MSRAHIRLEYLKDRRAGIAFNYDVPTETARLVPSASGREGRTQAEGCEIPR